VPREALHKLMAAIPTSGAALLASPYGEALAAKAGVAHDRIVTLAVKTFSEHGTPAQKRSRQPRSVVRTQANGTAVSLRRRGNRPTAAGRF